jgi:hypothetical protein
MPHDPHQRYAIIPLPAGPAPAEAIVVGGLSDVMSYLPQTVAREQREKQLVEAESRLTRRADGIQLRAEEVVEREREASKQMAEARAIQSDAIRRFAGDVLELSHRLDRFEQQKIADALRELPDSDDPEGRSENQQQAEADNLPPGPLPPPHGDEQEAEVVLERDDQGGLPEELEHGAPPPPGNYAFHPVDEPPRQVPQPIAVSLTSCDALNRGCFLTRRDWKAAKRRNRAPCR